MVLKSPWILAVAVFFTQGEFGGNVHSGCIGLEVTCAQILTWLDLGCVCPCVRG